ncbi:MAG: DUF87 domain-containing protein [Patescibacteria group bacterium]|nr:type IV secretion system DNA-binding domain-containing protein [Patescibacteria group bacterium]
MERMFLIITALLAGAGVVFVVVKLLKKKNFLSSKIEFDNVTLHIRVPKMQFEKHTELQAAPLAAEQFFSSLHGLLREDIGEQEHAAFEISATKNGIGFYCTVPKHLRGFVESQLYAQYPDAQITESTDFVKSEVPKFSRGGHFMLAKDLMFPIKTFRDFEVDPLAAITSALSNVNDNEEIWLQFLARPIPDGWQEDGYEYIKRITEGAKEIKLSLREILKDALSEILSIVFVEIPKKIVSNEPPPPPAYKPLSPVSPKLSGDKELELEAIGNKLSKMGFEVEIKIAAFADDTLRLEDIIRGVTASFRQFSTSSLNSLKGADWTDDSNDTIDDFKKRTLHTNKMILLNTEELASIFHLPSSKVDTPNISWTLASRGEPPLNLPTENCTFFGTTTFRDKKIKFGIRNDNADRDRHMYLVGKTGTGKSTIFKNMIIQDMQKGFGVGVIDPHGELVDFVLNNVPDDRIEDVVIFDPSDTEYPVGLNMLECSDPSQKNLMASGLLGAFSKQFGYSWGPRLEYLLNNAILTMLDVPGTTMLGITRLFADKNYQSYIVHKVKDPIIKEYWNKEFKDMKGNQSLITESLSPIQNKVGRFLSSSTIRNILGQRNSTVNLQDIMNNKKIFLVNLSKGKIGEDNAYLLGSLLVSRLFFEVVQRVNLPEEERQPFYLYIDEFQNFASDSFADILSEARKYRLVLHLTHQYTAQLSEPIQNAIFGNVGTTVALTLGAQDAAVLAPEFAPIFEENDLITLEKYHFYVKLMIDAMTSPPFSGASLPPPSKEEYTNNKEKVVEASRRKFGAASADVEAKIKAWIERPFDLGMAIAEEHREKKAMETQQSVGEVIIEG